MIVNKNVLNLKHNLIFILNFGKKILNNLLKNS